VGALAALAFAVAVGLVLVFSTDGDDAPAEPPGAFIEQVYRRLLDGQHGRAWDLLHPAHQQIVSRARYIECGAVWPRSPELQKFEVLDVYRDPIDVPHIPETTSRAVRYRVTVGAGNESDSFTATGHAVAVDGRWHWFLAAPDVRLFERGGCPA
jgi:hypothetical protein